MNTNSNIQNHNVNTAPKNAIQAGKSATTILTR